MSRRSALALLAAGATCLLSAGIPMVAANAAGANGSGLGSWGLAAAAQGVNLKIGEPTYCFVTPSGLNGCEGVVPEATSQLQNGPIGSATAAVAWPGSLASNAGSLLITASSGNVPPQATVLNDPVRAEARTGSAPDTVTNTSIPNSTMKAVAKPLSTSAEAAVQGMSVAAAGTFGPIKTHTDTTVNAAKQVTSQASSQVSNIDLAAGVVHIGSVTSTAVATSDGVAATAKGKTLVSNVTIAGFPATIDENGVTVQGTGLALTTATAAVNAALANAGMTLLVSQPQGKPNGADVTYTSGSLVAVFTQTGYSMTVQLGGASVTATAGSAFVYKPPPFTSVPGGVNPPTGTTGSPGAISPGTGGSVGTPSIGQPPVTTPQVGGTPPTLLGPVVALAHVGLGGGPVSPWLVTFGLLGTGLVLAGMRRLPDRVLEAHAPTCPLEET
jgi:hypothetical protein